MEKIKNCMRSTIAVFTVMAVIFSLILPSPVVKAEGTDDQRQMEKIEKFTDTLVKGAQNIDGKYVWNAKTDADDHRFTFRVDYSMSGVKDLEPGAIKIWIPKTILKDRSGKYADYIDLSIPSEDEYNSASEEDRKDINYVWKESTDEKHKGLIEITNVTERTAGENGYFEVAYVTNEQTFEYKDEATYRDGKYVINETPQSDPFYADISVTNISDGKPQTVTASTGKIPVYINTTAEISSTDKRYPDKMYRDWQSSWGQQPDEAKNKHFLVWEIVSKIKKDPTQPFTFTLNDTPVSKELHLLGYSMGSQSGPFTNKNYVENQRSDSDRYDYVLTYYDPAEFTGKDYYELKNSVKATVTPKDKVDTPTSANSSKVWEWDTPKFVHPTGHFYGEKYGDNNWYAKFRYYHDYSSYSLDEMQTKDITHIDTFRYYIDTYGYPLPWTRDGNADDPSSYGKKKVTFQLTDDELYIEDSITTKDTGGDQLEYTIPKDAHQLTADDYQFLYADWNMYSEFRKYDDAEKKFITDPDGKYTDKDNDIIHFWTKTKDSKKYTEVASYNMVTKSATIKDKSVVSTLTDKRITFAENADVTGIRFTTSNAYYYTKIEAYPMIRLKNSDYVMKKLFKDGNPENTSEDNCKRLIRLHNFAQSNAYQAETDAEANEDSKIYGLKVYAFDRAIRPKKESEIHKHIVSTGSDRIKKKYIIRWKITPRETLTTDSGTNYLVQNSGIFYDLLPKGTHLQKGSIDVETENGMLSHSSFSYSIEEDYKGSGRDLIKVSVPVQAKYYNLYLNAEMSWDAIHDYGTKINNPVAYETGNDEIYNGYPDSGGKLSDANKGYMMGLDPKCTANRFIYDEEPHDIDTVTAAVSGLKKQIKDEHDSSYSYETYTTPEGKYSYRIRFANTATDKAKNMIFFDSLENYNLNGKKSDWHGFLKRFDVSQLKQKGIEPVIYVSKTADLSIDAHHDLTDDSVWQKVTESTNLSEVHAFAIDCRKTSDGKDFILNEGESISAVVYMQAPESVSEVNGEYAKAYNNIYIQDTIMSRETSSDFFIHQDYTEIRYRVSADISIHKQNADDANEAVEGAKYKLSGTSDYGTEVNEEVTTGKQGNAVFEGIEKGTYTLKESYSPIDWLLDRTEYTVKVDGAGKITCDGKEADSKKITLKDSPRIHGDISFMKYSTAGGGNKPVTGAKFRLSGKSKYGTDVMEYATSDTAGKVKFENIEWGSYKLKEVETPDGYIPDSTERTAVISDSGIGGIEDAEMLKTGSAVIRNEPYHTVEISKQSSYDSAPLSGAEFKLTGTSDYGTAYDKTATSGENGLAEFTGLEAGTYIIQETKSPKDYFLDSTKHIAKVNRDDTYTIDGLKKNDSGYFRMNNEKENTGKIIVKKKWKDHDKTKRPADPPVIHITTDVNKVPTYAVWRDNIYSNTGPFYYVDPDYKSKTQKVEYAKDITSANQVPAGAVRLDENYNDANAKYKIWGWLDDGTMYYWTNAQITRLTNGSNMLFRGMREAELIDLNKIDTSNVTNMSEMFYDCRSLTSIDLSKFDTHNVTDMSRMFSYCKSLTSLDLSNFKTPNVTDIASIFYDCSSLLSLDLSNWETSNVTDMSHMFQNCRSLTSLDVSKFDTSQATNMSYMFNGCSGLTSLDVRNFGTSKVMDMSGMFNRCSHLLSLDVTKLDTSSVTNMSYMFSGCSGLASLDVSKFDTSKVTDMNHMFGSYYKNSEDRADGCSKLTSLDLSKFDTSKVTNMSSMFKDCSNLTSLDPSNWNTSNATDMSNMFSGCSGLTSLDMSKWNTSKVTDMSSIFSHCSSLTLLDVSSWNTSNVTNMSSIFSHCSSLTSLDVSSWNTSNVTNMGAIFYWCKKLTSLDLSNWNTSKVTNMGGMFYYCSDLTSLNVSEFDTSKVTEMYNMFDNCSGLTSLDLSSWNTSNVTNMQNMFYYCSSLTSLDLSNFDTSNVTDMGCMFRECSSLTSLDVSNFDTSNVTDMVMMFEDCSSLTSLDLSKWNTPNAWRMSYMFKSCEKLTSLDMSNFNTSNVTDMMSMFSGCKSLTSLDVSSWNTLKVTRMGYMFYKCSSLTSLNLSSWNTSKVKGMSFMFYDCSGLTNIYVSDRWNTDNVTSSEGIFSNCSNLPNYGTSSDFKTQASYGPDGYLTYKAAPTAKANTSNASFASRLVSMILSRLTVPVHAADSASYVSTDEKHCKITKDGDTWTYEFSVADDSAKYYAYEDDVEGYTSSNDASSYGIVTKDEPLTITNTANELPQEPKPASLLLSKAADGKQLVESDKPVEKYSHTSNIDDTGKANGTYSNNLRTNDIVTIPGASKLHVKLYCSTESTDYDWACVWAGTHPDYTANGNYSSSKLGSSSGQIGNGKKMSMSDITPIEGDIDGDSVTFGFRSDGSIGFYGYYAVVTGKDADGNAITHKVKDITDDSPIEDVPSSYLDKSYMFDITLKNDDSSKLSGTKMFGDAIFTDGKAQVGVKAGETKTFSNLPVGTQYKVTEEGGDWSSAYRITNSTDKGDIAQSAGSAEKNESLSTEWETADSGESINVTYTNTVKKYQNLVLKKAVTGGKATDKFRFRIDFAKLYETVSSDAGTIVPDDDGNANADVYLNAGDEIVFKNIPVTAEYKITEKANAGKASYTISGTGGKFEKSADGNKKAMKDLSTATETVDEGENATVTFTNDMPKTTSVTLKKQVSGAFASRSQFFRFTVSLTGADKKQSYSFDYTDGSSSHDGTKNAASITTDENGHGTADIWLKHNDTVVIKNIPLSAKYSIAENPGEYVPSITINGEKADSVSERSAKPDVIVFTNTNTAILPTGIKQHKKAIALVCTAIIALLTAAWYILKKRHKKENKAK